VSAAKLESPRVLAALRKAQADYIAAARAAGARTLTFKPPCGCADIETVAPPRGQTFDTLARCPSCGALHYKTVTYNTTSAAVPAGVTS
jgi:hypothetical protein